MKNVMKYTILGIALFMGYSAQAKLSSGYKINRAAATTGYFCSGNVVDDDGMKYCDGSVVVCPAGYYCPGDYQQIQCSNGKTSSQGATDETECYDPNAPTITMENDGTVSDTTLGTEEDGAIVTTAAVWEPNTININWKNASGETMTTSTCSYDGTISLPNNNPTKRGYTFTGWKSAMAVENTTSAESQIRDTDMASEMVP